MNQVPRNNFPLPGVRVWTEPLVARFKALLEQFPRLSYSQIADQLTTEFNIPLTKNSCIGYGRRIGVPKRQPPAQGTRGSWLFAQPPHKPSRPRRPRVPKQRLPKFIRQPTRTFDKLQIWQLERGECRWPVGDHSPILFCGRPQMENCSYCLPHARLSYPVLGRG